MPLIFPYSRIDASEASVTSIYITKSKLVSAPKKNKKSVPDSITKEMNHQAY